jgi:hypothetical protein
MTSLFIIIGIILFLAIVILFTGFLNQIRRALVGSLFTNKNIELYFGYFPDKKEVFIQLVQASTLEPVI